MAELQQRIVPLIVSHETFWTRYFYRLHKLKEQHEQRQQLAQRAAQAEEEIGWGDDDEEAGEAEGDGWLEDAEGAADETAALPDAGGKDGQEPEAEAAVSETQEEEEKEAAAPEPTAAPAVAEIAPAAAPQEVEAAAAGEGSTTTPKAPAPEPTAAASSDDDGWGDEDTEPTVPPLREGSSKLPSPEAPGRRPSQVSEESVGTPSDASLARKGWMDVRQPGEGSSAEPASTAQEVAPPPPVLKKVVPEALDDSIDDWADAPDSTKMTRNPLWTGDPGKSKGEEDSELDEDWGADDD